DLDAVDARLAGVLQAVAVGIQPNEVADGHIRADRVGRRGSIRWGPGWRVRRRVGWCGRRRYVAAIDRQITLIGVERAAIAGAVGAVAVLVGSRVAAHEGHRLAEPLQGPARREV